MTDDHRPTPPEFDPARTGAPDQRYLIRGAAVVSMDPSIGEHARADILVEGSRIAEIAPTVAVDGVPVVEAEGSVVLPGFVQTHHHLFETALRGSLADGLLSDPRGPEAGVSYLSRILGRLAPAYRPEDVYISTLYGALSQLDTGVTSLLDVSQIHHSPEHSDASVQALRDAGGRNVFGYFESSGAAEGNRYPEDARRIRDEHFASDDQLLSMAMGGEIYLPSRERAWEIGRELGLPIAAHVVGSMGLAPVLDALAESGAFGSDNLFLHMTGMSDRAWREVASSGAAVSMSVPIEQLMGHGTPPILKVMELGIEPSLSPDVETTLTADPFTQLRAVLALQRGIVTQLQLDGAGDGLDLLSARDVLRWATVNGARQLGLDGKVGTLAPGRQADLILLDARAVNVAPLNSAPGAVVSLMDRSNVDTVVVAGAVRKWRGRLLDVDLGELRRRLERSRDYLFDVTELPHELTAETPR